MKANGEPVEQGTNPYAAPAEPGEVAPVVVPEKFQLATRGARLLASIVDGIGYMIVMGIGFLVGSVFATSKYDDKANFAIAVAVAGLFGLFLYGYQCYRIASTGQSLGKTACDVRIVRENGAPAGFLHGVLLRTWLFAALGLIPYAGKVFGLVDVLLIFRADQRCLHDHVAGTIVIAV